MCRAKWNIFPQLILSDNVSDKKLKINLKKCSFCLLIQNVQGEEEGSHIQPDRAWSCLPQTREQMRTYRRLSGDPPSGLGKSGVAGKLSSGKGPGEAG